MAVVVGDRPSLSYTLRDSTTGALADGTVTCTVTRPDASTVSPAVVRDSIGQYHADVTVDQAGLWRWVFASSGAVVDVTDGALSVAALGGALPWAPPLTQVAAYVPKRTRPVSATSDDPLGTFTAATRPTDTQVRSLIDDACRWVLGRTGVPVGNAAAMDAAGVAAALRAAAFVELGYPGEDPDTNTGAVLLEQAEKAVTDVTAAADTDPSPAGPLLPVWSFPTPVTWGDSYP